MRDLAKGELEERLFERVPENAAFGHTIGRIGRDAGVPYKQARSILRSMERKGRIVSIMNAKSRRQYGRMP